MIEGTGKSTEGGGPVEWILPTPTMCVEIRGLVGYQRAKKGQDKQISALVGGRESIRYERCIGSGGQKIREEGFLEGSEAEDGQAARKMGASQREE